MNELNVFVDFHGLLAEKSLVAEKSFPMDEYVLTAFSIQPSKCSSYFTETGGKKGPFKKLAIKVNWICFCCQSYMFFSLHLVKLPI